MFTRQIHQFKHYRLLAYFFKATNYTMNKAKHIQMVLLNESIMNKNLKHKDMNFWLLITEP